MIDRLLALEYTGIKLGLENIDRLCQALGHPERAFRSVHVAGTNGKGSVTAMVHEALLRAGHRSARYTSPHLSHISERFVVGREPVTPSELDAAITAVLDRADDLVRTGHLAAAPTFFEATTAIAFELFRRAGVTVAVVEVGLGGRFDATNVLRPDVGAITSVGLDHEQYLGHTLGAIAFEKGGIIKPGMAVVTGPLSDEAAHVIADIARERGAVLTRAHTGTTVVVTAVDGVTRVTMTTPTSVYGPTTLGLRGDHQVNNAVVAVRLLEELSAKGVAVPKEAIEAGISRAEWPARLELVSWPGRPAQLLIDAAHNPDGARALAAYLKRWYPERLPLVIGLMRDKDAIGILEALLPVTSTIVATAAPSRRAMPPDELADRIRALDPGRTLFIETTPNAALDRALSLAPTVCVSGSIYLAGVVRDILKARAILR